MQTQEKKKKACSRVHSCLGQCCVMCWPVNWRTNEWVPWSTRLEYCEEEEEKKNEETVLERDPPLAEHIWSIAGNGKTDHETVCDQGRRKKNYRCIGLGERSLPRKSGKRNVAGTKNVKQKGKVGLSVQLPIPNSCSPHPAKSRSLAEHHCPTAFRNVNFCKSTRTQRRDHNKFCHTHKLYMHIATRHAHMHTCS